MKEACIINNMKEYMARLAGRLREWLSPRLPAMTENWWQELVVNSLSEAQQEKALSGPAPAMEELDLTALLRILDRNWFAITSKFYVDHRERASLKRVMEAQNSWAHMAPGEITKEKVTGDLDALMAVMQAFGASAGDVQDMEAFRMEIEEAEDLQEKRDPDPAAEGSGEETEEGDGMAPGSPVCLKSDPSVIGAVVSRTGNRYRVLINGVFKSYYAEQLQPLPKTDDDRQMPLERVRTALTAYQINHPGSSSLYSLHSARIDFVPYQFRPALKLIKADMPRLLVADDVGVGKTIEAGLILKELEARSSVSSVLIICPRPLVAERKWELEMQRFDEVFVQMDGRALKEAISEMDRDQIWPDRYSKAILPFSLFGEDLIMGSRSGSGRRKRGVGLSELDPLPHFDLVIVDEAHTIRNANTWVYRGVELFCRNADAVVFLTATPLQNSTNDLYTLLHLLRPDVVLDKETFQTMSEPNRYINNLLRIVRNQEEGWQQAGKEEIANILSTAWGRNVIQHNPAFAEIYGFLEKQEVSREERVEITSKIESLHSFHTLINRTRRKDIGDFCVRRTQTVESEYNPAQRRLYDALMEFESTSLALLHGSRSVRFMMCTIMRQAASCIYGLVPFLDDLIHKRMTQIQEDGELYESDCMLQTGEEDTLQELADEMAGLAGTLPEEDPKFNSLYEIICKKQTEPNRRVIVFSSFRHTLHYIQDKLRERGVRTGLVDGSVPDEERYSLRQRFLQDREDREAIDVLLFSEVGCEGLDYQFCDTMVNYDLPWNPMRIEQRIGRIDRRGQKSDTVRIYNMITEGTIDAVVYHRCLSKIGVFEESIGDCSEILGDISKQIMEIMFAPGLTEGERQMKIEQMADNEVRKVQEMQKLEQDERTLYGFDLSNLIQNQDVQDAENPWITPQSIQELVELFLKDFLGEGEYIRGRSELKTLRVSVKYHRKLLEHLATVKIANVNEACRRWSAYLNSARAQLPVTFDSVCAKDHREAMFLTQMHPLVLEAAAWESRELPCRVCVSISTGDLPAGDYGFLIYAWRYTGLKQDIRLAAVSENPVVEKNILQYLQICSAYGYPDGAPEMDWEAMDKLHYASWQQARKRYEAQVREECQYRLEQLSHSSRRRSADLSERMEEADDERIIRMRQSQLDKLKADFEARKEALDNIVKKVDLDASLQVKGILHVY